MKLSSSSPESQVLEWVNTELEDLFPSVQKVKSFEWDILIKDNKRVWAGLYHPGSKTIYLDPDFFSGHSETEIKNTLLHEICHHVQVSTHGRKVPPHGNEFRKLAYYVNGCLGREAVAVYHTLKRTVIGEELDRIRKKAVSILSLTRSPNEHEASLAASKYLQFVTNYNLSLDPYLESLKKELPEVIEEHVLTAPIRNPLWLVDIVHSAAYVHGCTSSYGFDNQRTCIQFYLYGRPHKISQAYDLVSYLVESVSRTTDVEMSKSNRKGKSYWEGFKEGAAKRVSESIFNDHHRRMEDNEKNLTICDHSLLPVSSFFTELNYSEQYMNSLHYGIGSSNLHKSGSTSGKNAGYSAGGSISTARQTTGSSQRALAGR